MKTEMNKIYCMDNVIGMKLPDDESVDLTVTSPPYEDLRKYNGINWDFGGVADQLYRVTKIGGVVVWVVSDKTNKGTESGESFRQALYFKSIGFNLHDTMIYYRWSGPLTHNRYEQEFEYMFVFSKRKPKTFNPIMVDCKHSGEYFLRSPGDSEFRNDSGRRIRNRKREGIISRTRIDGNVWKLSNASQTKEFYNHPAPFPTELVRRHVVSWSNLRDIVLDPFMGSGTTAVVAKELGRNFIGFEISQEYVDTANGRLK